MFFYRGAFLSASIFLKKNRKNACVYGKKVVILHPDIVSTCVLTGLWARVYMCIIR